ncbi:hypothetical protein N7468_005730 [Penicillium chermesinum]|uniref:Uncharacterized protein n=1 Tax=Penicillium chermesinum TaxID=63820 RepID=A0A9W9NZK4_9EURO|nr:uncharacterized protein N7468_005730 [Penicillium chermesinum]KAJ5232774.1 hypothetical protein N7468_005730 [Penicillium chermesinum]KAJ6172433.1 hypothetical protein N7470_001500 [Penicillium chermesinum]
MVANTLDDSSNKFSPNNRVNLARRFVLFSINAEVRCQEPGQNAPDLNAIFVENSRPFAHQHIHTRLARTV